ncbi:SMI1/KNR4 family protein [Dyadobacter diqingensis]|uniref:SMI1/KNR4 family protein n=1 Tax=Dyadobacter diqingensis TaxID=2938121 RepID=UPI0020C2EC2C|nr:SMI1/KNR4 family protein [Dyadobacter diqingensis]
MIQSILSKKCDIEVAPHFTQEFVIYDYDSLYIEFIKASNGGFFYGKSLHMYSYVARDTEHDIVQLNKIIKDEFGDLTKNAFFFGQDLFGNQFGFLDNLVVLFNIETGDFEANGNSFYDWLQLLHEDGDYLTGESLLAAWESENGYLSIDDRLCPKKPFVVGGEYQIENLSALGIVKNLSYNSELAKQIHNLSDGTPIRFQIRS